MNNRLCQRFGTEASIFAFSYCRDVVVEASEVGSLGVLDEARARVDHQSFVPHLLDYAGVPRLPPEQQARVTKILQMTLKKIAPLAGYLLSDASREVNAPVFTVPSYEISLMSQPCPVHSVHPGWKPECTSSDGMPALKASFVPLERAVDVFSCSTV